MKNNELYIDYKTRLVEGLFVVVFPSKNVKEVFEGKVSKVELNKIHNPYEN